MGLRNHHILGIWWNLTTQNFRSIFARFPTLFTYFFWGGASKNARENSNAKLRNIGNDLKKRSLKILQYFKLLFKHIDFKQNDIENEIFEQVDVSEKP